MCSKTRFHHWHREVPSLKLLSASPLRLFPDVLVGTQVLPCHSRGVLIQGFDNEPLWVHHPKVDVFYIVLIQGILKAYENMEFHGIFKIVDIQLICFESKELLVFIGI